MEIISANLVLFNDEHGVSLYIEHSIGLVSDEPIAGPISARLSPTEAVMLGRALIAAAPIARAGLLQRMRKMLQQVGRRAN